MARVYDIVDKITNGNKKPTVKIDADHEYTINNSKNTGVVIKALSEDQKTEDFERMDKIIQAALGKEALDYINSLELAMSNYNTIVNVIMAAISDMSLEEMEEFSKKNSKTPRK
jgi:hypothetical protein